MHTVNVIWTEKFVFMIYTYTNTYIYKQLKRGRAFEREWGEYIGGVGALKARRK